MAEKWLHGSPMNSNRARMMTCLLAISLAVTFSVAGSAVAGNKGTIKVHDDETADPEVRNQPHVSCDFWIEGFKMADPSGDLVFRSRPPTGDKSVVTPTGDDLDYTTDSDGHFLKGAYQLPEGHYKVTAEVDGHKVKSKVFWVDPCNPEIPFFPTTTSLVLGSLGALAMVGMVVMRRRS